MTIPVWMLLAFAAWTMGLLLGTVGVYRWSRILTGRVPIQDFRADQVDGEDWYKRAMRAHANCIENLPLFAAVVFALHVSAIHGPLVNALCSAVVAARVLQSLVHVGFPQTNAVVSLRFVFFQVQLIGFLALTGMIVRQTLPT